MVELLVASVAAVTVLGGIMTLVISSLNAQARDSEYALTLQEDRAGLARMVRDIRQATEIKEAKTSAINFLATIGGTKYQIKYDCSVAQSGTTYNECVRLAAEEGKTLPTTGPPVAKDLLNGSEVFTYSPSSEPSKVRLATLRLEIPAQGTLKQTGSGYTHHVVLEDGAYARYLYLEG